MIHFSIPNDQPYENTNQKTLGDLSRLLIHVYVYVIIREEAMNLGSGDMREEGDEGEGICYKHICVCIYILICIIK